MEKRRILFVDDEQAVLDGLRRMLHPMHDQWRMDFTDNGQTALDIMAKDTYDVIISDMQMPGMDGTELLGKVKEHHPQVIRIVLSGQSDIIVLPQILRVVHQFLGKPVESKRFIATVSRACTLKDTLRNKTLSEAILRMEALPSSPDLVAQLKDELRKQKPSIERVRDIITRDMGLTLKLLQLTQSRYYSSNQTILDPDHAVEAIGIQTIGEIIESDASRLDNVKHLLTLPPLAGIWDHCYRTRRLAEEIARAENLSKERVTEISMAAFLHDIGKLVFASHFSAEYRVMASFAEDGSLARLRAERQIFGDFHPEVGAFLLALWGLPEAIVIPVACHHGPKRCQNTEQLLPTAIIHVANVFEREICKEEWHSVGDQLDLGFLRSLDLIERLPAWQELCEPFSFEVRKDV